MVFLKIRKFKKARKPKPKVDLEEKPVQDSEELNNQKHNVDDYDEEDEEESETSSSEARNTGMTGSQVEHSCCDFVSVYEIYCQRMLFFDRISAQQLNEAGSRSMSTLRPKASSRNPTSSYRRLSLKKNEDLDGETEHLQPPEDSPYQDLETVYVAHLCLSWEALHSQYTQLRDKISHQRENHTCYNRCAQQYQQFQVLLQRFIENEPFEIGSRVEKYARSRNSFSNLLQVPNVNGAFNDIMEDDYKVSAPDVRKLIETSILTFYTFLKLDKKKTGRVRTLFGNQNQMSSPLQKIHSIVEKKMLKLNELRKRKGLKKKLWPGTDKEVDLLLSLIDVKVVSRVLRMIRITEDQLVWCENKMKKVSFVNGRLCRNPSPGLFPCQ